jgi:Fungal chitosanase of glycosyl hydrolase group 75
MSRIIGTISGKAIVEEDDGSVTFLSGATLDGDGANGQFGGDPCYAPSSYNGRTLDDLRNAGHPGNWFGVVTDNGSSDGNPVVQGQNDPKPGAYVSATSLHLRDANGNALPRTSPFKYVDSATVPFIVVPPMIVQGVAGIVMGCRAIVTNRRTGQDTEAVVADGGPKNHLGEISLACARAIGVPIGGGAHPANGGGADSGIDYQLFPGVAAVVNGVTYPLQPS